MPSSAASGTSGVIVMLIVWPPASRIHTDSARVEKRGPWITTHVPVGRNGTSSAAMASIAARRSTGSKGSAKDRCCTWSSKKVSARPHVRSISWSVTTNVPGA